MSDVGSRADDYERRLAEAGGTEGVIGGLVIGAKRQRRVVRWVIVSLAFDIMLSLVLGAVGLVALRNSHTVEYHARVACLASSKNSVSTNAFIELQIANTRSSSQRTEAEKAATIKQLTALIVTVPVCPR